MSATQDYIACEHCEHHESRSVFGIDPFCAKHLKDNPTPCSQFSPSSWFLRNYGNIVVRRLVGLEADNAALRERIDKLEWLREVEAMKKGWAQWHPYFLTDGEKPDAKSLDNAEAEYGAILAAAREAVES